MTSRKGQGLFGRLLAALGGVFERGILGKSSHEYMKQFAGSDQYWDRAIAAQLGWPQKPPPRPDPGPSRPSAEAFVRAGPGVRDTVRRPSEPEHGPVPG
jgi:hypothetical protein